MDKDFTPACATTRVEGARARSGLTLYQALVYLRDNWPTGTALRDVAGWNTGHFVKLDNTGARQCVGFTLQAEDLVADDWWVCPL